VTWKRFVAYALFLAASFVWIQWRRTSDRTMTVIGMVGFLLVFWLLLTFW
jgi:hypothetical protein